MTTFEAIRARKSVRSYKSDKVEREKLEAIVNAGNLAAKSANAELFVITRPEMLKELQDNCRRLMLESSNPSWVERAQNPEFASLYNAPAVIAIGLKKTTDHLTAETNHETIGCIAENMMLAAADLGLATCFTFLSTLAFLTPGIKPRLGSDDTYSFGCMLTIGYTDDTEPHPEVSSENIHWVE